jgi:hypothetical protein
MSSSYSTPSSASPVSSTVPQPVKISAGTAVKIGFFGALGATLFSLVLSLVVGLVLFILALLGIGVASLIPNLR